MSAMLHLKAAIAGSLPTSVLNFLLRLTRKKPQRIDLSVVRHIRDKNVGYLGNAERLESELLPLLGLNDEKLEELPAELHPFCGYGVLHWQYPKQFGKYLAQLSGLKIESYLEIGVRHGGTFVITAEYLEKFQPLKCAVGVDVDECPSLLEYRRINPKAEFFQINSQSPEFKDFIAKRKPFDLVLIDGLHSEAACWNDFQSVRGKARIIALHDIASVACPGVVRVWERVKSDHARDYQFIEYVDQYDSVAAKGQSFFGIGLAIRK